MIRRSIKTRILIISTILFLCIGQFTAFGQEPDKGNGEGIRYFTQDIIVELIHAGDGVKSTRKDVINLSQQLSAFFTNFEYKKLRDLLFSLVLDNDRYGLTDDFDRAIYWLDKNKNSLFKDIQIDPAQYYEFILKENYSFATITMDTSKLNLSTEEQDFMLLVFSVGMTAGGPYYLNNTKYTLRGISLNWMMAGQSMSGIITGGPGGLPVAPAAPVIEQDYTVDASGISASSIKLPASKYSMFIKDTIRPVKESPHVFILDTIPDIRTIFKGYGEYEKKNKIINNIFSLIGTYHSIQYYGGSDPDFTSYMNEHYRNKNLSDHGTFIAGIVHLLSPDAHLHLIEVMNHYAAGTLDSLLWGFQEVLDKIEKGEPFVVNTSLTTKLRFPGKKSEYTEEITDMSIRMIYGIEKPEVSLHLLRDVTELINNLNGVVIAAAGNDSERGDHYDAGYPANFEHVIGVGSTQRNGLISSFSNEPGVGGLMAFGGEVNAAGETIDGILSIYISNPYTDSTVINSSGWARWAGSSFATGMVSGAMALLISQGYIIPEAIKKLRDSCYPSGGYDVLPIEQGP